MTHTWNYWMFNDSKLKLTSLATSWRRKVLAFVSLKLLSLPVNVIIMVYFNLKPTVTLNWLQNLRWFHTDLQPKIQTSFCFNKCSTASWCCKPMRYWVVHACMACKLTSSILFYFNYSSKYHEIGRWLLHSISLKDIEGLTILIIIGY